MEARFQRYFLQESTGWQARRFSLEDQRHLRRIRQLHQLTLSWIAAHPDWSRESERFLLNLRLPSRLRLPTELALALLDSSSSESVETQLIDEKSVGDCLLRLHQLAWRAHGLTRQQLKPEEETSLSCGKNAATAFFKHLGITPLQRFKWTAAEVSQYLASPEIWPGSNPELEQGLYPFFLFRRLTPDSLTFEILAGLKSEDEEQIRSHHLAWLKGWIHSASEGQYELHCRTRRTARGAVILEVLPS